MPFHLVLPGLLWPQKALRDTAHDLLLPNLSWLLGRGRLDLQDPLPLENWLCREFGCYRDQQSPPAAALRLLGEGGSPGADIWLCADPMHMRIEQGRARLLGSDLAISTAEMQQLADALIPFFTEIGAFQTGVPGHGYLRLNKMPRLLAKPPSAAAGRGTLLPAGEDAALWMHLGNEAQMLLHALPLNTRREAAGRPRINSLWFWGAGSLPASTATATAAAVAGYQSMRGDQPLLKGLAKWAGIAHYPAVSNPPTSLGPREPILLLLDELQQAAQTLDAGVWRDAIMGIEQGWLTRLCTALRSGRLDSLRLTALGDEACLEVRVTRSDAMKFWRRPRPLHEMDFGQ